MINPFYMSAFTFIGILFAFSIRWSNYYQQLDTNIYAFIFINVILCTILGFLLRKNFIFKRAINKDNNITRIIFLIFVGYGINYIYSKEIPLINVLFGIGSYYKDINHIPTFYPLLTAINVFCVIYCFFHYLNFKEKKNIYYSIILLIPFLLNMGRGIFIMSLIPCLLLYLSHKKYSIFNKKTIKVLFLLLLFLYAFGHLGNIRTSPAHLEHINPAERILFLGDATDEFRSSYIPKEYFWTYIYISSPIANLSNFTNSSVEGSNFREFIIYNFFPQSLMNRSMDVDSIDKKKYLIVDTFNVSTAYAIPFYQFGWAGVFFYQLIHYIIFFLLFLIVQKSPYKSIFLSLYSTVSILSLFSNVFVLDIIAIPIVLSVLVARVNKKIIL